MPALGGATPGGRADATASTSVQRSSMRSLVSVAALLSLSLCAVVSATAAPHPPQPQPQPAPVPTGTLSVCNTAGARAITNALGFSFVAPASAGGTQSFTVPVGSCAAQVFYPLGTSVVVNEAVPAGYVVTSIAIGGGSSTITTNTPAAGSATVTIGAGQSLIRFITSGPPRPCTVPAVKGLALISAKSLIVKNACSVGRLRRVYSRTIKAGRVVSQYPGRATTLSHGAPVDMAVSRGPR
jgi:PASTA domain